MMLGGLATGLGVLIAAATYYWNSRVRHAEWLASLHNKFFEENNYKQMRWILDYQPEEEIRILRQCIDESVSGGSNVGDDRSQALMQALEDYLNFFEFIASLWQLRQLSLKEIRRVFDYYILQIGDKDHQFLQPLLNDKGFENLKKMITKIQKNST
ncbi:MAG: hypothetical protein OEU26_18160 [Candidatus Tectomicrobia bacterium]|nr:hypothetical protein [Candidatus Tectomicrobia bacterium]